MTDWTEITKRELRGFASPVERDQLKDNLENWIIGLKQIITGANADIIRINTLCKDMNAKVSQQALNCQRSVAVSEREHAVKRLQVVKGLHKEHDDKRHARLLQTRDTELDMVRKHHVKVETALAAILQEMQKIRRHLEFGPQKGINEVPGVAFGQGNSQERVK